MKITFKSIVLFSVIALLLPFQSCKDDEGGGEPGPTENIYGYLTTDGGYSAFLAAIDKFGLKAALNADGGNTLLAVSDLILTSENIDLINMDDAEAENFIKYHYIGKQLTPDDISNNGYLATESAGGPNSKKLSLFTEVVGGIARFNGKNYIKKEQATNGIIYVMEGVIQPPTVLEALAMNPNIKTYKTAVNLESAVKADLGTGPNTVFATSETKFVEYLNDNNTTVASLTPSTRRAILHNSVILGSNKSAADLSATETTKGEDLLVTESGGTITLNGKATIQHQNGQCTDGVIHVISDLLN